MHVFWAKYLDVSLFCDWASDLFSNSFCVICLKFIANVVNLLLSSIVIDWWDCIIVLGADQKSSVFIYNSRIYRNEFKWRTKYCIFYNEPNIINIELSEIGRYSQRWGCWKVWGPEDRGQGRLWPVTPSQWSHHRGRGQSIRDLWQVLIFKSWYISCPDFIFKTIVNTLILVYNTNELRW